MATKRVTAAQAAQIKANTSRQQQSARFEAASDRGAIGGLSFPSTMSSPDVGSRMMPQPAPVARHLSGDQFGSSSQPDYSSPRSMLPGGYGSVKPPIDRSPKSMTTSMHPGGGAATGNNAVPSFAPTQGTVLTVSPISEGGSSGGLGAKLRGMLGRMGTGGNSAGGKRKGRVSRPKPSVHAGSNAKHLANITGSKG